MKRALSSIILALFPLFALAQSDPAEHPNVEKGFSPEKMYQYSDIDSLNLFNGNVMLMIPIGGSYRVGPSLEYKVVLAYNAKMWDHTSTDAGPLAQPVRTANAGLGWQVSFGRVLTPQSPENDNFHYIYVDQSGLQHRMFHQLHKNDTKYDCTISGLACDPSGPLKVLYTNDNTYLRLIVKRDDTMTIDTPDGATMTFDTDGRLTRMADLFGNWVNVSTSFFSTGVPSTETITDSRGRSHTIQYGQRTNSQRNYKSQIDTITLEAFETTSTPHTTKATWTFHYADTDVDRFRIPSSAPASNTVRVPLLTSLDLPGTGGSYELDYFLHSTTGAGANNQMGCVRKMVYPTRGRLEWDYSLYSNAVDTCGLAFALEATPGVKERRFYNDATTTTATAVWLYDRHNESYSDVEAGCGHFPANRLLPEYLSNTVTRPDGAVEKHYFSAWPSLAAGRTNPSPRGSWGEEVGSPFTRWNRETQESCDRDELCLSLEVFADGSPASRKRSTFVSYENDESDFRPTHPNSLNRRMQAQQTIYHDDGGVFTRTESSNFDGFGHYRQATSSGNFGSAGDLRTSFTRYNPAVPPYPNVPPVTWNTPWLFTNRDQACVRDGNASPITDCLGLAGAAVTQFHMDASGFLVKKRTLLGNSPGPTDLLLVQTHDGDGFPTRQRFFGGDRQTIDTDSDIEQLYSTGLPSPVYDLRHTYVAGTLATSRHFRPNGNPGEFFAVNNQIDVNTGLVKKTIDPSGVTTRYTYDSLSRLASVDADGLALTTNGYDLQPGSGAKVTQTSASTTGSIVTEYEFDGLGRMTRQTGSLEDGTRSSVRMGYDGLNRKTSQTEPATGETDGPSTTTQYDIFNRPTLITPPDGAAHNITMQYDGMRTMRRTRSIGTSWNGSAVTETPATDTETRDALGRLVSLQQPNNVTATYDYDQLDRMTHVRVDGPGGGAQDRSWEYDNRGFLTKELQPESNQTVFEDFDARGHAWGTRTGSATGAFAVNFQFDYAERLDQVKEGAGQRRLLKEFIYDSTSDAGHQYSAAGKLVKAIRHNWVSLSGAPDSDTPVTRYVQYGANGRISKQSTIVGSQSFTQNFPYNDLGAPSQLRYPTCDGCGVAKGSRDISLTYGFGHLTRVAGLTSASQLIDYWPNGMTKSLTHVAPGGANPVVDSQTLANGMLRPGSISFTGIDNCAPADTTITAPASIPASASGSASVPTTAGATYAWSVTGGTLASPANGTSITFTAGCSGNVTVTVTTTSSCGAVSSASKQVAINQPTAVVSGGGSIPPGGNATIQVVLTGVAPFRVTWSDGVVQTGQPVGTVTRTVSPTTSTTYTATATDAAGCAAVSSGSAAVTLPGTDLQASFTVSCDSHRTCLVHTTSTGSITRWQWNWGDGTSVIEPGSGDQSHTYAHSGNYTITHTVFNGAGNSSATQRSVLANSSPDPGPDSATTCRGTAVTINVLANDSDPDGDPLTLTIAVAPEHGSVTIVDGSKIRYTPNAGFVGTDPFTYQIADTFGASDRAVVTITVIACGAPVARNDHATTKRDTPVTINLLENDHDPENQAIGLTPNPIKTAPRHGTIDVLSSTSVRYTPETRWGGNDVFEYEIQDASGNKDRAWVAVHVGRTRLLPVAVDDTASTTANRGVTIDVLANDSSPEGDPITLTGHPFIRRPLHGRVTRVSDSRVSYTPHADWTGTDTFTYEISDSEYRTAAAFVTVTVTSENRPPVAAPDSAATGVGVPVTINVTANDSDPDGDPLALTPAAVVAAPQHGSATRVSASSIAYTPAAGYVGTDSFQYEISDGHGRTAQGTVTITISDTNHPPEALDDDAVTTAGVAVTIEVTANDSDVDNDQVSLITNPIITPPVNGTAVKVNGTSITYTPRSGYTGTDRFQYEIGDHNSGRARAWVDVTIGAGTVNHNPVAVDDDVTMLEATTKDFVVTANDSDPDGDIVSLISSPVIVAPAHGTATRLNNTTIRYTPSAGYVGMDTLQYEIGDGRGKRSRAWMRVMVREANSRPVAVGDEASTTAGTAVTVNVTSNDYDPDGDVVRLLAGSSPIITAPEHGTATKVDADRIKYVPQASFSGTDRFQYEISDGRGGRHRAWVNITVSGTSATSGSLAALSTSGMPPLAGNDAAEAFTDTSVAVVVLANDLSVNGRQVVLTANPIITPPLFGTAQRTSDTTLTYTPSIDFRGNDRLEYEVVDADGVTTTAWVTVQIPGDNKPPVAISDVATAAKDGSVTITPAGNDTDENGDALVLTVRAVAAAPQNGTVRRESDTQLLYTPSPGFIGDDTFVYEITDRRGGSAQAAVTVHVIGGAQTPVAANDSATVQSGKAVAVNVVANDSDPDGDPVRVVASEPPLHGTILWSDGTATYQSHSGYVGPDSFLYTISDPTGLSAQGTVSVTVAITNNPTIVANDSVETKTRTPVLIGVLANDYDPDPQRLTIASVTQPARGTVAISNDRLSVTYTPANDFAGNDAFQYTVTDGPGSVTASAAVTVTNQAPLPHSEILSAPEDTWVGYQSYNVIGNDVDPDGDELHIVSVEQPVYGQFLISPDSSQFSYKSKPDWSGLDSFYYTVGDPFGAQVRVFSQIMVSPVNDAPVANGDSFSVYKNQVLNLTQAQIVANDTDIEGHEISVYSVGPATNGATRMLADGSIEYAPYGEFVGTDSFEYTAQDSGGGAYATARITVTVLQDTRPVADFTVTCNGFVCAFDASASTDDRGIVSYQWLLKTGAPSSTPAAGRTFSFTYPSEGVFEVRLTVEDVLGQTAAAIKWATVCAPPGIASQPASQTIFSGYTATLSVTASGTGPFSYQWYEGTSGTTTTPVGTNSSTYTTPGLTANKSYWVRATSTCSGSAVSVNSNTATVTICQLPGFATQPASKTINSGATATLSVVASGSGPFTYQWYDADTNAFVGTGSTYTAPALTATKSYWVRVTSTCNGSVSAISNIATVTVCDPPVITTHPAPKLINAGATATLNVASNGSGPFSYQWFEGPSGTTTTPVGTNSDIFTTPALAATKTYWARVTSTCNGSTSANSNAATVTVCSPPGFATQPPSKTIPTGTSTTLTVAPSGSGPFSYQWYEGTAPTTTTPVGTNSSSYTTPVLTTNKSYWVRVTSTCNGVASANSNTATITMTCATPPSISASPTSRTIVAGQPTTLSVTASGFGTLTYQWYQGTAPSTTTPVGTNSSSLTVTPGATTNYWVQVSNACGGTASATATVTLCNPPVITTHPASTTINYNATATLSVVAGGTGPFSYQWYEGASGVTTTPVGTNSASFTTPALGATKSYWVRVSNACSTNSNAATVTVNGAALARRQSAASTANSQLTITTNWTQPTQAGNLLVAIVSAERGTYPIANWQPPAGWQLAVSYEMVHVKTSIYYYPNNPGGRTAETFGNGGYYDDMILQLAEYTGVATTSPLDKTAFNGNNSNDGYVDTGYTPQTSQAKELVITGLTSHSMTNFSGPSQGFLELDDRNQGWGTLTTAVHERFTTTAGSWGHNTQVGNPAEWIGVVATFRAANP